MLSDRPRAALARRRRVPSCVSQHVIKRGFDDAEPARQRYECHDCDTRFDDLTDTIFAGHHQSLKVWILCLYFMGLNLWLLATFGDMPFWNSLASCVVLPYILTHM